MPSSSFPRSQAAIRREISSAVQLNILKVTRNAFARGFDATVKETLKDATAFKAALDQYRSGKGGSRSLASANKRVMAAAQEAVLASYDERVTHAPERFPSYRIGQNRNSGGALRRALENPEMFAASYQGFAFMNTEILDREASHWARLNWGAGEAAGSGYQPVAAKIVVFGQQLGPITAPSHPQPAFLLPPGLWVGMGQSHKGRGPGFYPKPGSTPVFHTKGIAARRFFDAAFTAIAEQLPIEYENLLHEWVDQAGRTFKGLGARAGLTASSLGSVPKVA